MMPLNLIERFIELNAIVRRSNQKEILIDLCIGLGASSLKRSINIMQKSPQSKQFKVHMIQNLITTVVLGIHVQVHSLLIDCLFLYSLITLVLFNLVLEHRLIFRADNMREVSTSTFSPQRIDILFHDILYNSIHCLHLCLVSHYMWDASL